MADEPAEAAEQPAKKKRSQDAATDAPASKSPASSASLASCLVCVVLYLLVLGGLLLWRAWRETDLMPVRRAQEVKE